VSAPGTIPGAILWPKRSFNSTSKNRWSSNTTSKTRWSSNSTGKTNSYLFSTNPSPSLQAFSLAFAGSWNHSRSNSMTKKVIQLNQQDPLVIQLNQQDPLCGRIQFTRQDQFQSILYQSQTSFQFYDFRYSLYSRSELILRKTVSSFGTGGSDDDPNYDWIIMS
jgi:hypothetical protein